MNPDAARSPPARAACSPSRASGRRRSVTDSRAPYDDDRLELLQHAQLLAEYAACARRQRSTEAGRARFAESACDSTSSGQKRFARRSKVADLFVAMSSRGVPRSRVCHCALWSRHFVQWLALILYANPVVRLTAEK